ncbi:MAG: WD40 repeat domain-containing protein [Steroidobacteraceae bacterium]
MRNQGAAAASLLILVATGTQASERLVAKLDPALVPHTFLVSPDGLRFGYVVRTAEGMAAVVDGRIGKSYPFVGAPAFSGDGSSVAYSVSTSADASMCRPPRESCAWFVVKDGQEGARYDATSRPVMSHDGRHMAYWASPAGGVMHAVVDGNAHKTYLHAMLSHDSGLPGLVMSPDGRRVAYAVSRDKQKWFVVLDGQEGKSYDEVWFLTFSPDGTRLAYHARVGAERLMVVDGQESKAYDNVGDPIFSPDSRRFAYRASPGSRGKWLMVVDGQEGKRYDDIGWPAFSPDGQHISHAVESGRDRVLMTDNKPVSGKYDFIHAPVFSPDGRRIAFIGTHFVHGGGPDRHVVVVDGVAGNIYDQVESLVFSPDGRHVAYAAQSGNRWSVVVDGKEIHSHEGRVPALLGRAPEAIVYTARSGDQVIQKVEPQERQIDDGFPLRARLVIDSTNTLRYLRAGDKGSIYLVEQPLE